MITYTTNKIIAENNDWMTKSIAIDELLWAVKSNCWFIAKMKITTMLMKKLEIDKKQALIIAGSMKPDFETFYNLN